MLNYRVLQLDRESKDYYDLIFQNYATNKGKVTRDSYKEVFSGTLEGSPIYIALEKIYNMFQCGKFPEGYTGHSLSVSDIVEINGVQYYCDSFGWKKVK